MRGCATIKPLPEVLIGGYPNSGTSFLCQLVVQLDKSPGSSENLKDADSHNRWGYFEHLPLRDLVWEAGGWRHFAPERKGFLPNTPLKFDGALSLYSDRIRRIAEEDNVEVYKENSLPLTFRLFPKESKYIIISRQVEEAYKSPKRAGFSGYQCGIEEFRESYRKYYELVDMMAEEVDCVSLRYEDFKIDFDDVLVSICGHLKVTLTEELHEVCRATFRPRRRSQRGAVRITDWLRLAYHKVVDRQ